VVRLRMATPVRVWPRAVARVVDRVMVESEGMVGGVALGRCDVDSRERLHSGFAEVVPVVLVWCRSCMSSWFCNSERLAA
jgi:hypothetical protein